MERYPEIEISDQIIDEIISDLPLKFRVSIANLEEGDVEFLKRISEIYIRSKIGDESGNEDISKIMVDLWQRLKETHRLKSVK